jgi:hypothetical protein
LRRRRADHDSKADPKLRQLRFGVFYDCCDLADRRLWAVELNEDLAAGSLGVEAEESSVRDKASVSVDLRTQLSWLSPVGAPTSCFDHDDQHLARCV